MMPRIVPSRRSLACPALALLPLFLVTCTSAGGENWPQWRGPHGNSVSQEKGLPVFWDETRSIRWKCSLPEWGASTPAIWNDAIFITSHTADDKLVLVRIDKANGQIVWTREVGAGTAVREAPQRSVQKFHEWHNLASPSPVTDGRAVVVHFGNGDLAAYDFDGNRLWRRNLVDDHGPYTIWWGHANSPVLFEGVAISVCMQDSLADIRDKPAESYLVAHDLRDGHVKWKSPRMTGARAEEGDSYTTPVFRKTPAGWELIVMGGNELDAYDPATGKQLWRVGGLVGGRTVTGPTLGPEMIYATRGLRGPLVAVRLEERRPHAARSIAWEATEGTPDTCTPVLWNTLLFTVSDDGIARCYDALTGHLKWKERLKGKYKASPMAAEARIYYLNTDGLCTVVSASSRFDRLTENQLDDATLASPAASDGRLFIRGKKTLYCIGHYPQ
jgi:outer membrane protein assembly factor BamB